MRYKSLLLALPLVWGAAHASEGVVHHKLNGMPISESVEISSSKNIIFLSGKVPTKISKDAPEGVLASYGNTEAQTINIMEQIKAHLAGLGLEMKDVVKMQVFWSAAKRLTVIWISRALWPVTPNITTTKIPVTYYRRVPLFRFLN